MVYLLVSVVSAMAISISVYAETSSFLLAFVAYTVTGTLVLGTVLLSAFFDQRAETESDA